MENFILKSKFFEGATIKLPKAKLDGSLLNGGNQKKILIVCSVSEVGQSIDDDFLKKILASVQIDLTVDTTLWLLPKNEAYSWKTIKTNIDFAHLVFFGNDLSQLGLQVAAGAYTPFQFQGRHFLIAEPLKAIANDRAKKGALWNALKQVFL